MLPAQVRTQCTMLNKGKNTVHHTNRWTSDKFKLVKKSYALSIINMWSPSFSFITHLSFSSLGWHQQTKFCLVTHAQLSLLLVQLLVMSRITLELFATLGRDHTVY